METILCTGTSDMNLVTITSARYYVEVFTFHVYHDHDYHQYRHSSVLRRGS